MGSVEILPYGESNKHCILNKQAKRDRALANWKWEDVIDLESSDDLLDSEDSSTPPRKRTKIPRVMIKSRNRCYRLHDESDKDDYFYIRHAPEVPVASILPLIDDDASA